jgi:hypothetical protein
MLRGCVDRVMWRKGMEEAGENCVMRSFIIYAPFKM